MRKVIALTAAAGLLLTLAGCTVSAPSGPCEPHPAGDASTLVTATGDFDKQPTVSFPTPLTADSLEVSVLDEGDGKTIHAGDFVFITYTAFDPASGEQAAATSSASVIAGRDSDAEQLFECLTVGSRVAALLPGTEATDDAAATATSLLVIDIDRSFPTKATGRIEVPQQGLPSIVTAPDGRPGFTILNEDPPAELKYATLVTGNGPKVAKGDQVLLQYTVVNWETKDEVDTTWGDDKYPQARTISKFSADSGEGVNAGTLAALTGATVGSQIVAVLPPSTWAGGDISAPEGATLVVVYDILGIL